ncbi:histidine kinase [Methylotuvimicrobium sp. KM1]|uniref:histidine kinase n=1 Tax=Methylotuvimicrobium sp. KM1 TaxID=3377707 RepID=UPI00384E0B10
MNLKLHLLSRIVLIAVACLIATAAYVLYQADQQAILDTQVTAESIDKQLELQLMRIDAGFGQPERFPDFNLWKETSTASGICISYLSADNSLRRNICHGAKITSRSWPMWFESFYQWAFHPGLEVVRPVAFKGRIHGSVIVAPNAEMEIASAWQNICNLMGLSASSTLALCLLVYFALSRALYPAQIIVAGLEKMEKGELSFRLPTFELDEWQRTGKAINQLAASLEQLFSERKKLALKLMNIQEDERSYLARELHDEFGQCLAAINAVAASISQTAENECPELVPEGKKISRIVQHMMESLRGLLLRIRPSDIDELGLTVSLKSLVAGWNASSGGKIHYRLAVHDDLDRLPEPIPITIFRIVQECLTNVSKHSAANNATVTLQTVSVNNSITAIELSIEDDGKASKLPFENSPGIGLLGIRERVSALEGRLTLKTGNPSGLAVHVWLPVQSLSGTQI